MFKRILSLLIISIMLISVMSCGSNGDVTVSSDSDTTDEISKETESDTLPEADFDPYTFTEDFKVGYARVDITPDGDIPLNTGVMLTKVKEPLYATCVAIKSGEETIILFSLDIKNMDYNFDSIVKSKVKLATGVPIENIMVNTMHNHSAPCTYAPSNSTAITKWRNDLGIKLGKLAKEAVDDLSDARPYIGTGKTTNLAFVRRYIYEDGSCITNGPAPIVKHESEADDNVQVIRFVREDKKDVVLANWQAHVAHAIGAYPNAISGDYVYHARKTVEEGNNDVLFAYFLGAAGNINLLVRFKELDRAGGSYVLVGRQLGREILATLDNMTAVNAATAESTAEVYVAKNRASTEDEYKRANAFLELGLSEDDKNYDAKLKEYGFQSKKEVDNAVKFYKRTGTSDIRIGAISLGDISFVCVPYEMFDTNGMEIKAASPDKMTFILAFTGGAYGYVPSALAVPNGSYEVYSSSLEYGTAEKVAQRLIEMLKELDAE